MKLSRVAALGVLPLAIGAASLAVAHEDHMHSTNPLVDARQGGMTLMVANLGLLGQATEGEGTIKRAAFPASGLASFARAMPTLFGADTADTPNTKAKPAIWEDPAGFKAQTDDFIAATSELHAAARADDREAFTAALDKTKAACKACHDVYRAE